MRKPRGASPTSCTRIASPSPRPRASSRPRDARARHSALGEAKRGPMSHAACFALPGEPVVAGAEAHFRAGACGLRDEPIGHMSAKIQASDAALERRAEHQVDHGPAPLVLMLDRETQPFGRTLIDRPVWFVIRRRPRSSSRGVVMRRAAGRVIFDVPSAFLAAPRGYRSDLPDLPLPARYGDLSSLCFRRHAQIRRRDLGEHRR